MIAAFEFSATTLNYPSLKGTQVEIGDNYSSRSGRANVLSLAGYSGRYIKNEAMVMGNL